MRRKDVDLFLINVLNDENMAAALKSLTIVILSNGIPGRKSKIVVRGDDSSSYNTQEVHVHEFLRALTEESCAGWIDKPKLVIVNAPRLNFHSNLR